MIDTTVWPWLVRHDGHEAWYLRAFVPRDFLGQGKLVNNYVLGLDGDIPDHEGPIACGTCGQPPNVKDLVVEERATGRDDFLDDFRSGPKQNPRFWPQRGTDKTKCWYCNDEKLAADKQVKMEKVAARLKRPAKAAAKEVKCCANCSEFLLRERVR